MCSSGGVLAQARQRGRLPFEIVDVGLQIGAQGVQVRCDAALLAERCDQGPHSGRRAGVPTGRG